MPHKQARLKSDEEEEELQRLCRFIESDCGPRAPPCSTTPESDGEQAAGPPRVRGPPAEEVRQAPIGEGTQPYLRYMDADGTLHGPIYERHGPIDENQDAGTPRAHGPPHRPPPNSRAWSSVSWTPEAGQDHGMASRFNELRSKGRSFLWIEINTKHKLTKPFVLFVGQNPDIMDFDEPVIVCLVNIPHGEILEQWPAELFKRMFYSDGPKMPDIGRSPGP